MKVSHVPIPPCWSLLDPDMQHQAVFADSDRSWQTQVKLSESQRAAAQESASEPDSGVESAEAAGLGSCCPAGQP